MDDQIIRQLKKLRAIEPEARFVSGSRRAILATRREAPASFWFGANLRLAGLMAGMVAVVAASVFLFSGSGASTALASPEDLNREFSTMNINVELKEIDYRQSVSQTVASALSEISDNKTRHLNENVLQSESDSLIEETPVADPQVDKLLNQVIN